MQSAYRQIVRCFALGLTLLSATVVAAQTNTFGSPIAKEELELKDNPQSPGDAAMILYREIETDSAKSTERHYTRINIFTEAGRKYADIDIPYLEKELQVQNIQARTINPGGEITNFDGAVFERSVARSKRFKVNVKSFTLPHVQAGSIIEYAYELHQRNAIPNVFKKPQDYIVTASLAYPAADWVLQRDLFVRRTRFVFHPFSKGASVQLRTVHLPKTTEPQKDTDGNLIFDVDNIPAFREEEYAPPEDFLQGHLELFYTAGYFSNDDYWMDLAKYQAGEVEKFLGRSKAVQQEAARLVSADDSAETKLRKIYARVQRIRYVSFERSRTAKEQKQEDLKPNKNVEDVLNHGYAFANEINMAFVALARAAGLEAYLVRVASRERTYFLKNVPDPRQLDAEVVEVRLNPRSIFLDPATRYCPYGLLPWDEAGSGGIRLDERNALLLNTPAPGSSEALISRKGNFKLDEDRNLQGTAEISFLGQEALTRRIKGNDEDEAGRRKLLEDEIKSWLPDNATVHLLSAASWDGSDEPLTANFAINIPGFASQTGQRLLFPVSVFHTPWRKAFLSPTRTNLIDLHYGRQERDELTLSMAPAYQWEDVPRPRTRKETFAVYDLSIETHGAALKLTRQFKMDGYFFPPANYASLRGFFEYLRSSDDESAVLRVTPAN
jgi:hypothetical protein